MLGAVPTCEPERGSYWGSELSKLSGRLCLRGLPSGVVRMVGGLVEVLLVSVESSFIRIIID